MSTPLTSEELRRFESLVLPHVPALRVRARRLVASSAEAQDLVQDTLEKALRSFPRFQTGNTLAWLGTIMFNQFIDRRRQGARQFSTLTLDESSVAAPEPEVPPASSQFTGAHVRTALQRLTPAFRDIGTLHLLDGCSHREISERLNLPVGTVGTRVMRAKRKLRALLCESAPVEALAVA